MAAWDRDKGIGNKPDGEPEAAPACRLPLTVDDGRKTITFRRMTPEEIRARDDRERKERRARSIV